MNNTIFVRDHLELFLNRNTLHAMLLDINGGDLAKVTSMMHAYDEKILDALRTKFPMEAIDRIRFATNLVNKYGIREEIAKWTVDAWADLMDYTSLCQISGMEAQLLSFPSAKPEKHEEKVSPVVIVKPEVNFTSVPFPFHGKRYKDKLSLFTAMAQNWEDAKQEVFRKKLITDYFRPFDLEVASLCMDAQYAVDDGEDQDIALFKLLYSVAPEIEGIYWRDNFISDIVAFGNTLLESLNNNDNDFIHRWEGFTSSGLVYYYIKSAELMSTDALRNIENKFYNGKDKEKIQSMLYSLAYSLSSNTDICLFGVNFHDSSEIIEYIERTLSEYSIDKMTSISGILDRKNILPVSLQEWLSIHSIDNSVINDITVKALKAKSAIEWLHNSKHAINQQIDVYRHRYEIVTFGQYYINNSDSKESINWRVLNCDDDRHSLLVSDEGLDCKLYDRRMDTEVSWSDSELCTWLNNKFLHNAFSRDEILSLCAFNESDDASKKMLVSILSYEEATKYLGCSQLDFVLHPTIYAIKKGCRPIDFQHHGGWHRNAEVTNAVAWWLRTDKPSQQIDCIHTYGNHIDDININSKPKAVRPTICVDLDSHAFRQYIINRMINEIDDQYLKGFALAVLLADEYVSTFMKIGDTVNFGSLSHTGNKPLKWQILAVDNSKALLITRDALLVMPYSNHFKVSWQTSEIREWLVNSFYDVAFGVEEKECILESLNDNILYRAVSTEPTNDFVFLLSRSEFINHVKDTSVALCHLMDDGHSDSIDPHSDSECAWWLRSAGSSSSRALYIDASGKMDSSGEIVNATSIGVRPAIWVDLDKLYQYYIHANIIASSSNDQIEDINDVTVDRQCTSTNIDLQISSCKEDDITIEYHFLPEGKLCPVDGTKLKGNTKCFRKAIGPAGRFTYLECNECKRIYLNSTMVECALNGNFLIKKVSIHDVARRLPNSI